ncbi:hypothetical protein Fot_10513 [Forsythia ovata]|uniref:Uncharacterized protein n=1 Tax=Forsythia ovata TaxID=205694 RepID=A0ABD1WH24_9LAMI
MKREETRQAYLSFDGRRLLLEREEYCGMLEKEERNGAEKENKIRRRKENEETRDKRQAYLSFDGWRLLLGREEYRGLLEREENAAAAAGEGRKTRSRARKKIKRQNQNKISGL